MSAQARQPTPPMPRPAASLTWLAEWLERYSQAALRIARFGVIAGTVIALMALAGNIFTRQVLGFSLFGAHELASCAFLWTNWLGVSLAVKRSAVTVITFLSHRGPWWWQAAVRTFSTPSSRWGSRAAENCWSSSCSCWSPR
jgi:hypothetical protein